MPLEPLGEFTAAAAQAQPGLIRRIMTGQVPWWIPAASLVLSGMFVYVTVNGLLSQGFIGCVLYRFPHYVITGSPRAWDVVSKYNDGNEVEDSVGYAMIFDLPDEVQPPLCVAPLYTYRRPHLSIGLTWAAADPLTEADIDALIRDVIDAHDDGVYETRALKQGQWTRSVSSSVGGMTIDVDYAVMDRRILWSGVFLSAGAWLNLFVFLWSCSSCFLIATRRFRRENHLAWCKANRICPTCRYDLRGADHLKCPECGTSVPWRPEYERESDGKTG